MIIKYEGTKLTVLEESANYYICDSLMAEGMQLAVHKSKAEKDHGEDWEDVTEYCVVKEDQLMCGDHVVGTFFTPYRIHKKAFPTGIDGIIPEGFTILRQMKR